LLDPALLFFSAAKKRNYMITSKRGFTTLQVQY
jgi:hypothetical protein